MRISALNNSTRNYKPSFEANVEILGKNANKLLPKGAQERLNKLAKSVGSNADTVFVGLKPKSTHNLGLFDTLLFSTKKRQHSFEPETLIRASHYFPSQKIDLDFISQAISGNPKERKTNAYKTIYKYILALRDNGNRTI